MLDRTAAAGAIAADGPHVRVENVVKSFGTFTALRGITLDVARGELVCFLGPSGCGKTTLLRVIAGLERQDGGRIVLGGRDVSKLPPARRDFGIVFQSYALFPNLKVDDNVGYGLVSRRRPRAEVSARVSELLTLVGLSDQGQKYPAQLSGGQQQRVALARALATSPSLLLLDEPLSALDARVRVTLREEIRQLQRRFGITTILVTHDQEEALTMADRIVVMNGGAIEQVGTSEEIYSRPASGFVAQFVGTMNFLEARVRDASTVDVAGMLLSLSEPHDRPAGSAVRLGLRPEEIRIRGIPAEATNRIMGRVVSLEYLGSFCRAALQPTEHPTLRLTADFSTNEVRELGIRNGETIAVLLPAESIRVFDADTGRTG